MGVTSATARSTVGSTGRCVHSTVLRPDRSHSAATWCTGWGRLAWEDSVRACSTWIGTFAFFAYGCTVFSHRAHGLETTAPTPNAPSTGTSAAASSSPSLVRGRLASEPFHPLRLVARPCRAITTAQVRNRSVS